MKNAAANPQTSDHTSQVVAATPVKFQPYVELLTWGSVANPQNLKKNKIPAKYKHYVAEQMKFEPVGHTSLRFQLPADPAIRTRLQTLNDKGVSFRETMAYVGVKNCDGTTSRQSLPVFEIYFSWWPKKFKHKTFDFDTYSELSNRLSEGAKEKVGSNLMDYKNLYTSEHSDIFYQKKLFEKNILLITDLRKRLQSRNFIQFDVNKVDFMLQLIQFAKDFSKVTNTPLGLIKILKDNDFEVPKKGDNSTYRLNYETGEFVKAIKILDHIYDNYVNMLNNEITNELMIHQEFLRDNYEMKGKRPDHTLFLPLTMDNQDGSKLNAMTMLDMIEQLYENKNYHFFSTNCAAAARKILVAGMSQEMRDVKKDPKTKKRMFKKPWIETPSSVHNFGLLLQKQMVRLSRNERSPSASHYLQLINEMKMTPKHQILIAKSLQFLKLLEDLSASKQVNQKQADKLAKLTYDLTTNPKYHRCQFNEALSATKLKYGTKKDKRLKFKSLGSQMLRAAEAFVNQERQETSKADGSLSRFSFLAGKSTQPKDNDVQAITANSMC